MPLIDRLSFLLESDWMGGLRERLERPGRGRERERMEREGGRERREEDSE